MADFSDFKPFQAPEPSTEGRSGFGDFKPFSTVQPNAEEQPAKVTAQQVEDQNRAAAATKNEAERFSWAGSAAPYLRSFSAADPLSNIPLVSWAGDKAAVAAAALSGKGKTKDGEETFADRYNSLSKWNDAQRAATVAAHPIATTVGELATVPFLPTFGAAKLGPLAAGLIEKTPIGTKLVSGAVKTLGDVAGVGGVGAIYSGAKGAEHGDTWGEHLGNALQGAKEGATQTVPIGGYNVPVAVLPSVLGAAASRVAPYIPGVRNLVTRDPAERMVGAALENDAATKANLSGRGLSTKAAGMSDADIAAAQAANQPVMLADTGGEHTRTLARSVANVSPEAKAILAGPAMDRSATQADRFSDFITSKYGPNADAGVVRNGLEMQARQQNGPAYKNLYTLPHAQSVWDPKLSGLLDTPAMQSAIGDAEKLGKNVAGATGRPAPVNPFFQDVNGNWVPGPKGPPSLEFWDNVKQSLDDKVDTAFRTGSGKQGNAIKGVRDTLRDTLDTAVPEYKNVRQGAAAFFNAQDAHEAGVNFLKNMNSYDFAKAKTALAGMNAAEKNLFSMGMASTLVNTASKTGDSASLIRKFATPQIRQKMELGLGTNTARDVEMYLAREAMMDHVKTAVTGNSSTVAQNLANASFAGTSVLAGGTYAYHNWDNIKNDPAAFISQLGAAVAGGVLLHSKHVTDARLAPKIAELLTSDAPGALQRLSNAAKNERIRTWIRDAMYKTAVRSDVRKPQEPPRQPHAAGGSVKPKLTHEQLVQRLIRLSEQAKKAGQQVTKPLLNAPDDAITHALKIAEAKAG